VAIPIHRETPLWIPPIAICQDSSKAPSPLRSAGALQNAGVAQPSGRTSSQSAKGAQCKSLGQRPRNASDLFPSKPQRGEMSSSYIPCVIYFAPSELDQLTDHQPGALPQASALRAFGAWLGVIVRDNLVKIVLDTPDSLSNRRWMKQYKDRWRSNLEQTDLWMVSYAVEVE
jgi:hypothetical protein